MSKFRDQLRNLRWQNVLDSNNVNDALDNFLDPFMILFDLHFPLKKVKLNRNYDKLHDFMTKGLLISRRRKNKLYKVQIVHPTHDNVMLFKRYRNIYNSLLRKSKKLYFEEAMQKFKSKPKKIWEILNSASGKANNSSKIDEIRSGNNILKNYSEIAQAFNDYFCNIGSEICNSIEQSTIDPLSYIPVNPDVPNFVINSPGPSHVIDVVNVMQPKSSSDSNSVNMKLIKFVIYEISVPLSHIFKLSISTGTFPDKFKTSRVVPIFKQGDPKICDNYRPIALVNSFSKILEKIIATDLYNHLDLNNLLYLHQYGFQRKMSTEHNLIQVTNFIGNALNNGDWVLGIFLDLKKAFDTVQHDILLRKLERFGVNGTNLSWFKSYLSNRLQGVDINGSLSDLKEIIMSVLQGSSLGPILFLCFINDIHYCTNLSMYLFADDTNALAQGNNLHNLIDFVNIELQKLASWFKANRLAINANKTKYIIFRTKNRTVNLNNKDVYINFNEPNVIEKPELKIKLTRVHSAGDKDNQTIRALGVIFDEFLNFNEHVLYVKRKLAKSLYLLNRSKNFLTKKALKLLYFATFHSHITYCPIITSCSAKTNLNKILVMQKKAIRIITFSKCNEHTGPLFLLEKILPFDLIVQQAKLLFMHSVKYNYCPKSYDNVFVPVNHDNYVYDLRYPNDFEVPRARIELFKKIPLYTLPTEWNNSLDLRFYQNLATFKIILSETLFRTLAEADGLPGEQ
jgi:hypothetical protein